MSSTERTGPSALVQSPASVCQSLSLKLPLSSDLPLAMTCFSYAEYFSLFHSCPAPSRSTAPPESGSAHLGLFQGVMQKYKRNKASQLA